MKGLYSALLVPFDEEGNILESGLRQIIRQNIDKQQVDARSGSRAVRSGAWRRSYGPSLLSLNWPWFSSLPASSLYFGPWIALSPSPLLS